ncbi:TatD DNase family Scn1 [Crepidotus variabilis]|uniref:TatD DNase family Scn1 n=1 Tax=Crepidotus variabilis TaxID=179855 RepID=A0A9P6JTV7_9AGAR|nr:TatD DNase family Scn1 [Crepidotus variabilis]
MTDTSPLALPSSDILAHITDVHCHPTDAPGGVSTSSMQQLGIHICAMSSGPHDQEKVKALATAYPEKATPAFGYHPWFCHLISTERSLGLERSQGMSEKERHYRYLFLPSTETLSEEKSQKLEAQFIELLEHLPDPTPISATLSTLQSNLESFPNAMLGEVGLDRIFRVPLDYFSSPRTLTPFQIPLEHQLDVLEAQLELAIELGRNVSMHSVKSQQATVGLLDKIQKKHGKEKWNKISVDMHSCGLSSETWRDLEKRHANVFISLSTVINTKQANLRDLISRCSPDRLLVESDYNNIDMVTPQTWDMVQLVSEVRGWPVETEWKDEGDISPGDFGVIRRLERNWKTFRDGNHPVKGKSSKVIDFGSEDSES